MTSACEVLNPWAEVDPLPLSGLSPRLADLSGKKIGLFDNHKRAVKYIHAAIEQELRQRFDGLTISRFRRDQNSSMAETPQKAAYEEWVKEQDALIFAVGD